MKRILALVVWTLACFSLAQPTAAAEFSQGFIRLDRMKAHTPTTGLICAQPVTSGVESKVEITFPNDFAVSGALIDWTTSASTIPAGATAWPGATVLSIAGNTVSFSSDDLAAGILYCFQWINPGAVTIGAVGPVQGILTTKDINNAIIDSSTYNVTINSNDQLSVTATVPANSTDADVILTSITPTSTLLREDSEINLQVQYRSLLSSSQPFTLEAYWDQGLVSGTSSNYIDVFEYVIGSATDAYGSTPPTIDLTNKKITWEIASLPPSSSFHTVSFSMKVRSSLPTSQTITNKIHARGQIVSAYTPTSTLEFSIQKVVVPTPTITPTAWPGPTSTPGPGPTTTIVPPTPTITPSFRFNTIDIREITSTTAQVYFSTSQPNQFTLSYGTEINRLDKKITGEIFETRRTLNLADLENKTRYYFQIRATDRYRTPITSDIFTFETAVDTSTVRIDTKNIVISSKDILLNNASTQNIVVPPQTILSFHISIENAEDLRSLHARFTDKQVLGINNIAPLPPIERVELLETLPRLFSAKLLSPEKLGEFTLNLLVEDVYGGTSTITVPYTIYVSDPITVIDKETNLPIENAELKILKYEESLKRHSPFGERFSLSMHTDEKGQLMTAFPQGTYIIEVKADGYTSVKKEFKLGISTNRYPLFSLQPTYSWSETAQYFINNGTTIHKFVIQTCKDYFVSRIARNMSVALMLIMTFIITIISMRKIEAPSVLRRTSRFYLVESFLMYTVISFILLSKTFIVGFWYIQGLSSALPLILIFVFMILLSLRYFLKIKHELL